VFRTVRKKGEPKTFVHIILCMQFSCDILYFQLPYIAPLSKASVWS